MNNRRKELSLYYLLDKFPSPTEYFILEEIIELKKMDVNIQILALRKPSGKIKVAEAESILPHVLYDKGFFNRTALFSCIHLFKSHSGRYLTLFFSFLFHKPFNLRKLLSRVRHFVTASYFVRIIENQGISHIHAHFATLPAEIARLISKISGSTYSISAHAHDLFVPYSDLHNNLAQSRFVVTCTRFNQIHIQKMIEEEQHTRVYHIYHGINPEKWPFRPGSLQSGRLVKGLTVARMVEKKGLIFLIRSLQLLKEDGFDFQWKFVGEGPLRPSLEKEVQEAGLSERVEFLGLLSQGKTRELYAVSDLFILPCINAHNGDRDGLPNVIAEAMASGLPVISTRVSAIPELLTDKETGLLIPEKDAEAIRQAVYSLVNDPALFQKLSWKGRQKIESDFDKRKNISQLKQIITEHLMH